MSGIWNARLESNLNIGDYPRVQAASQLRRSPYLTRYEDGNEDVLNTVAAGRCNL